MRAVGVIKDEHTSRTNALSDNPVTLLLCQKFMDWDVFSYSENLDDLRQLHSHGAS